MKTARIEARLDPEVSPDSSCSVYWLVPDTGPEELKKALVSVTARTKMVPWGFIGMWDQSTKLESRAADISRAARLTGHYSIGDTRITANVMALPVLEDNWFWSQFAMRIRPYQLCAALMPSGEAFPAAWAYAGLQVVLAEAARQVRPGRATHGYTMRALAQAFFAETLLSCGIAVSRLRAEMLGPGVALTASKEMIDEVEREFQDAADIDPLLVERSRFLGGSW